MATTLTAVNPWVVSLSPLGMLPDPNNPIKGINTNMPFAAGQFLRIDTSGRLIACLSSPAAYGTSGGIHAYALTSSAIGAAGTDTVLVTETGISPAAMPGNSSAMVNYGAASPSVRLIHPDDLFAGHLYNSGTWSDAYIGLQCMINVTALSTTGSIVTVDVTTTYPHIQIVDAGYKRWPEKYASDDVNAVVLFKVLTAAIQAPQAA
jgi:hypothetical protein